MRIHGFIAALWLLAAQAAAGQPVSAPSDAQIAAQAEAYMQAAARHDQFTGAILVARDGKPVISKAYGKANYELDVPNTPDTVFQIASLTKQFTAAAILQLQEQGKLRTSDRVCQYLDDCPQAWQPITLRQLLTHTSGLKNYSSLPDWDEVLGRKTYRPRELVDLFRTLPLEFVPGTQFKYSNSGYVLLGLVIERASGRAYGTYLRDHIFAPLGMTHSVFDEHRRLIPGRATGYYSRGTRFIGTPYNLDQSTQFASSGIAATTTDLFAWDQALYTTKLLSQASRDEMFTANLNNYAYGWQTGEKLGRRKLDHSGSSNGYSSYLLRFPDERVSVIVLSNSDRTSAGKVGNNIAAIVFGTDYALPTPQLRDLLWDTLAQKGTEAALQQYRDLRRAEPDRHDFSDDETLVDLGYDLIDEQQLGQAAAIFRFNLEQHPGSSYSHDGLADVALAQGDTAQAVRSFEQALALDPSNEYAKAAIERLQRTQEAE